MNLFETKNFISHSGDPLDFKIECDALTNDDWRTLAFMIHKKIIFHKLYWVSSGGDKLGKYLATYLSSNKDDGLLIIDDVLTTGKSMLEAKKKHEQFQDNIKGVVVFSRLKLSLDARLSWISPIFQVW